MNPVAVRDWSPLAGLGAEALRPVQNEAIADSDLLRLVAEHDRLTREHLRHLDIFFHELPPGDPRSEVESGIIAEIGKQAMAVEARIFSHRARTLAGVRGQARVALRTLFDDPRARLPDDLAQGGEGARNGLTAIIEALDAGVSA